MTEILTIERRQFERCRYMLHETRYHAFMPNASLSHPNIQILCTFEILRTSSAISVVFQYYAALKVT